MAGTDSAGCPNAYEPCLAKHALHADEITNMTGHIAVWSGLAETAWFLGFFVLASLLVLVRRERRRTAREHALHAAFQVRTAELDRERLRERGRSAVLEQLVGNQPLGGVLDSIASEFNRELPGCLSCVLLRRNDGWRLVAAPGVPREWSAALRTTLSVKGQLPLDSPEGSSLRAFLAALSGSRPLAIHCRAIGNADSRTGMLLIFETNSVTVPADALASSLQSASQLAYIAIEHWRFYEDLRHRAHHDSLTGLPNRSLMEERLAQSLQEAGATRQMLAVLSVDIDRFKRLNDTIGHRSADIVLAEIAARIAKTLRAGDVVARMGGDEFMVIVSNIQKPVEVDEVSTRILDAIRQPMLVGGKAVSPTASLGSALFPGDAGDSDGLRRKAEGAMRCAKSLGRNRTQSFGVRTDLLDRDRIEEEIREALEFQRLAVHYQPKVGAAGCFCGLEALVRISSAAYGSLSPAVFIPVAEESGLIHQLGAWVLSEVCGQMVDWHTRGLGWVPVAVNVSPAQISRSGFSAEVQACLRHFGVPPSSVELELTESIVLGGGHQGETQMRELRDIGIRFSIDDFGTGYSSLSYLYRLPVDAIKLDRSFVQALSTDQAARRLVQAMIGVAEGLGLAVIAEGVETNDQRLALIAAGCPVMQGYFFARPAPAAEIEHFLQPVLWPVTGDDERLRAPDVPAPCTVSPPNAVEASHPSSSSDDLLHLGHAVASAEFQQV